VILLDQIEGMIERSRDEGRQALLIQIMPEKLPIVEADAEARHVLGRGTIFGIPYEPHPNANGQGAVLIYKDSLPE
jgi:hypothetical protein